MPSEPREPADHRRTGPGRAVVRPVWPGPRDAPGKSPERLAGRPAAGRDHWPRSFWSAGVISSSAAFAESSFSLKTLESSSSWSALLHSL